jgi:3-oxoacyl-[acyl-carrier-protein] synthase-3
MFINHVSSYVPLTIIDNLHFEKLNGLVDNWLVERTGIKERRRASAAENTNTMAMEAVKAGLDQLPYHPEEIDLIVGATYTPYDTIVTVAHAIQHFLGIPDIPVVSVSSACSSLLNALEVVQGYFQLNKASKALVVASDHNSHYSNEADPTSGHLWGDGAAAVFVSKSRMMEDDMVVKDIITKGAATRGKATEAIVMRPNDGGLHMAYGKDIFANACHYMAEITKEIVTKNEYGLRDIDYLIPHQANQRIIRNVLQALELEDFKGLTNVEYLGNTGCAGCAIALGENLHRFRKGDLIVVTVFGGGYSYGAMLLEKN